MRSLDWLCLFLIAVASFVAFLTRGWWSHGWFPDNRLQTGVVGDSVALIIAFSVVRWASSLFRSGVMGIERQVIASATGATANTVRLLGPIPLLWVQPDIRLVFGLWLIVSIVELVFFRVLLGTAFTQRQPLFHFSAASLLSRARLAGGLALLAVASVLATQTDKLLLSRLLPLSDFGYFTLAVVLAKRAADDGAADHPGFPASIDHRSDEG